MEGIGIGIGIRTLVLVTSFLMCLTNIYTIQVGNDDEDLSFWQNLDETASSTTPHINVKVYRCGESCVRKCIELADDTYKYTNCTTVCMEPCVRSLVDGVYNCTFGCTKSLSLHSATNMEQLEDNMSKCYDICKKDFN